MMFKSKFALSLLSATLVTTSLPTNAGAEKINNSSKNAYTSHDFYASNQEVTTFESDGIVYELTIQEDENKVISTFKSIKGIQTFTRYKDEIKIHVNSDYLSPSEVSELEESVNYMASQVIEQVNKEELGLLTEEPQRRFIPTLSTNGVLASDITPLAQTGSWAWSNYQNISIDTSTKVTVTAVTAAIVAGIPYVGGIAAGMATIIIEYKMKTGFFKRKIGTRLDTDARYYWQQIRLELYRDSARTNLLSTKYTDPTRYLIMN